MLVRFQVSLELLVMHGHSCGFSESSSCLQPGFSLQNDLSYCLLSEQRVSILAEVGWRVTYLFSLWYLSWFAGQSIYYISIIQATGIQLTSNYMEFHKVLCFLFIIQKILYLEEQKNRDLFQYRLHLKIISWWMLFFPSSCYILKWHIFSWSEVIGSEPNGCVFWFQFRSENTLMSLHEQ